MQNSNTTRRLTQEDKELYLKKGRLAYTNLYCPKGQRHFLTMCVGLYLFIEEGLNFTKNEERKDALKKWYLQSRPNEREVSREKGLEWCEATADWRPDYYYEPGQTSEDMIDIYMKRNTNARKNQYLNQKRQNEAISKIYAAVKELKATGKRITGRAIQRISKCHPGTVYKHTNIWKTSSDTNEIIPAVGVGCVDEQQCTPRTYMANTAFPECIAGVDNSTKQKLHSRQYSEKFMQQKRERLKYARERSLRQHWTDFEMMKWFERYQQAGLPDDEMSTRIFHAEYLSIICLPNDQKLEQAKIWNKKRLAERRIIRKIVNQARRTYLTGDEEMAEKYISWSPKHPGDKPPGNPFAKTEKELIKPEFQLPPAEVKEQIRNFAKKFDMNYRRNRSVINTGPADEEWFTANQKFINGVIGK